MRHQKAGRKFNRTSAHRQVMFSNMASSLFKNEIIRTTLPKAKELRRVAEPLITLAKTDGVANRRLAFSRLRDSEIVAKLFDTIGPRFNARPGGYTRILHMEPRPGDNAPMALMQLVERSAPQGVESAPQDKKAKKADKAKPEAAAKSKEDKKAEATAKKAREKAAKEAKAAKAAAHKAARKTGGTTAKKKKAAPKKKKASK